ncbi:transposase-like protein [Salinibacter ruber]|nr:transposase [Salinibacter ruber]MCS4039941.1 transposase-like protein [Salinibacter ruber]
MATFEITINDEKIQDLLRGDRGMAALLEPILNQILQAEMTEHLKAEPGEQTSGRRGYRNGSYERELTKRVGTIELEVPRDRDGMFQTALFQRYQRSEKALVLALMQMVLQGVSTCRVKKITTELCGREFSRQTVSNLTGRLDARGQFDRRWLSSLSASVKKARGKYSVSRSPSVRRPKVGKGCFRS